jgi:transposase
MRTPTWVCAALSHPCFTGISRQHLGDLIAELIDPWTAQHEAALTQRRGHERRRAAGAGPKPQLVFCDRVLVTLVVLRFQLPHQALAVLYGVDRSSVTRAVHEVRPLLARRGFAVPGQPQLRLRTLADVFAYASACGVQLRVDASETQVRRPRAHRPGRRAFVSGKRKQNTIKVTTCSDGQGRTLWSGTVRPGRMHDQTAAKRFAGSNDMIGLSWQHGGMRPTAYRRNARGLRDRQAFEGVRRQAAALFAAGHSQAEVAYQLGVARQNVSRWHARWRQGGLEALHSAGPTGPTPRLSDAQLAAIDRALREGARAHGFDTDHWTLARVAAVIEQQTGVAYHPGHVWKLLRRRLHYRLQRPARRAIERDERAIARWVAEDWP